MYENSIHLTPQTTGPFGPVHRLVRLSDFPAKHKIQKIMSLVFKRLLHGKRIQQEHPLRKQQNQFVIMPGDMESNIHNLKAAADLKEADVIVSLVSGTCKAVLPKRRRRIETEEDFEGVFYTDDHVGYVRLPRVDV